MLFVIDCILNLLVGFYDKEDKYETKVVVVIVKNYNNSLILEIIYYIVPIILEVLLYTLVLNFWNLKI